MVWIFAATFALCYAMTGFLMILDHRSQSPIDAPAYVGTPMERYALVAWPHAAAALGELGYRLSMLAGFIAHTLLWVLVSGWMSMSGWVGLCAGVAFILVPILNLPHKLVGGIIFVVLRELGAGIPGHLTRPGPS